MRVSASDIAGLFFGTRLPYTTPTGRSRDGILQRPKKKSAPNDFTNNNVFPHGNVNEHKALEIIKRHYPDTHGQTAFARMLDHCKAFEPKLEMDDKYATSVGQSDSASRAEFRLLQHWKAQLSSYRVHGVTYDIGRREKKIGNVTVLCQPDGLCEHDKTAIEIKCPFGNMYTLDNTEKWLKHIVQVALEMLVFHSDKALLVVYFASRVMNGKFIGRRTAAKTLTFTRTQLGPLISKLGSFIYGLGQHGSGNNIYEMYMSCESHMKPLFIEIQKTLQKLPLPFEDMTIPNDETTLTVVFINDRSATLQVGVSYKLVAEPGNRFDSGAIRVLPGHALLQMPAPCYVTRSSKGSWLLPMLDDITYCRAISEKTLQIKFGGDDESAAGSRKRLRHEQHKEIKLVF